MSATASVATGTIMPHGDKNVNSSKIFRLAVVIDEHGLPAGADRAAIMSKVPHRQVVGVGCGVRPRGSLVSQAWVETLSSLGIEAISYEAAADLSTARLENHVEVIIQALRLLRDPKVDALMLVCPTGEITPLARAVQSSLRTFIVACPEICYPLYTPIANLVVAIDDAVTPVLNEVTSEPCE